MSRGPTIRKSFIFLLLAGLIALAFAGCASHIGDNLSKAILNQDDPDIVRDGAPAYLLLVDSLIEGSPKSVSNLIAGAKLNAVYAGLFVQSPERAVRMADKAHGYGQRALCLKNTKGCGLVDLPYEQFIQTLKEFRSWDVPALYAVAVTWLVKARAGDGGWSAMADLPKIEALLERIIVLDDEYEKGSPQYYLGVLNSLRPPSMGGTPDKGRQYFEQAIVLTDGRNLSVKVAFARYYARLVYDQELHDRLLTEVLEADPRGSGLTLTNVLAQQEARRLLDSSSDYF